MDIYFVYALKSDVDGRIYVGFSSDVDKRLIEHNSGKTNLQKAVGLGLLFILRKLSVE